VTARFTNLIGPMQVSFRRRPGRSLFLPMERFRARAKLNPDIADTLQAICGCWVGQPSSRSDCRELARFTREAGGFFRAAIRSGRRWGADR
jgi:hypothetical protein